MNDALTAPSLFQLAVILPILVLIEGFFSGAEMALLSSDKLDLRRQARLVGGGATHALTLANHPDRVLSTTLLITNLCVIGISTLLSLYFSAAGVPQSDLLAVAVSSILVVIFGELIPKTLYQRHATVMAPWVARPLLWTYWALYPITGVLGLYTGRLSQAVGPLDELATGRRRTTRDEIKALLLHSAHEPGGEHPEPDTDITPSETQMIDKILNFRSLDAKQALIPLVQVNAVPYTATIRDALAAFAEHQHSRMPVYTERIDNITAILEASQLLTATDLDQSIHPYLTPARFVAQTHFLEDLVREMARADNEMVIIVDEYGGAVGILTFEDIVEEIVGEINDEFDYDALPYQVLNSTSWLVQATMEIDHINESLQLGLPLGDYETLSGFLLEQFGRIPEPEDQLQYETTRGLFEFTIHQASERQIETVHLQRLAPHATN